MKRAISCNHTPSLKANRARVRTERTATHSWYSRRFYPGFRDETAKLLWQDCQFAIYTTNLIVEYRTLQVAKRGTASDNKRRTSHNLFQTLPRTVRARRREPALLRLRDQAGSPLGARSSLFNMELAPLVHFFLTKCIAILHSSDKRLLSETKVGRPIRSDTRRLPWTR